MRRLIPRIFIFYCLEVNCSAETIFMDIKYLPDNTDDCVNNIDKPVLTVAEATAATAVYFCITAVTFSVRIIISVSCLFNHIIDLHTAVETVTVICISVF